MKKKFAREMLLLTLPAFLIIGAVLWSNGGGGNLADLWRPHIQMGPLAVLRYGPLSGQNAWNDDDLQVVLPVTVRDPFNSLPKGAIPFGSMLLTDSAGHLLARTPLVSQGFASPSLVSSTTPANPNQWQPTIHFDLDRVPLSLGEITLNTSWKFPDGHTQPFSFPVRPAWFCHSPSTLQLVSANLLPPDKHSDGSARVVVRATGTQPLGLNTSDAAKGSSMGWTTSLSANGQPRTTAAPNPNLLYNWSPRFQSRDGQYNSHDARDAYVWKKIRAPYKKGSVPIYNSASVDTYLREFSPSIETLVPKRKGNDIEIIYRFHGLGKEPRAQVFVTDIGVPLDGFLSVKVPLTR